MKKYRIFKIEDLFCSQNGNVDIQQCHINGLGHFVVSSGLQNYGIIGKTDLNAKIIGKNTITIDMFGNSFFRDFDYKMVTHARVFSISYKFKELNYKEGLYFVTLFNFLKKIFSYNNMATWDKVKILEIKLPINQDNEIDYKYMEHYISELEEERISELEAYLKINGFDDYELTQEESSAIENLKNKKVQFNEFDITGQDGLFNVKNTHSILQEWIIPNSGTIPYVTAGVGNNSITTNINALQEWIEEGNSIMIGGKTLVITYQENDYVSNDSHNLALYLKDERYKTENIHLFLVSALYKSLKPKYEWGNSISKTKIQKDKIKLPIDENKNIDYKFMETYISGVKKLSIRNVVDWKDKIIKITKDICNK